MAEKCYTNTGDPMLPGSLASCLETGVWKWALTSGLFWRANTDLSQLCLIDCPDRVSDSFILNDLSSQMLFSPKYIT